MSGLLEMLVVASLVSGAAAACLALLPGAPPRVRFRIALLGLAAWAVPWPLIQIPIDVRLPSPLVAWPQAASAIWSVEPTQSELSASASVADLASMEGRDEPQARTRNAAAEERRKAPAAGGAAAASAAATAATAAAAAAAAAAAGAAERLHAGYLLAVLLLPGLLRFVGDALALRASISAWRARSFSGETLRAELPPELRNVRASIRIVRGTAVAAASGWLRPVVWIGEQFSETDRAIALVHELAHVRRRDPLWMMIVTATRRAYWWNPAVAWLGREAVLMMESDCDRRCARWLGTERYRERLASMMLDAVSPPPPRLVAPVRTPSLNVQRLKLLAMKTGMRRRDYLLLALLSSAGAGSAAYAVVEPAAHVQRNAPQVASLPLGRSLPPDASSPLHAALSLEAFFSLRGPAQLEWRGVVIPDTPAGRALTALLDAFNAGDAERLSILLGAFTPQEVEFRVPRSSGGLELVAIVHSEPLLIEYVVQDFAGTTRLLGRLEVDEHEATRVSSADLSEWPAGGGRP